MGFNSVYRSLQEVFPQVDARILKAVAIEHPKDADSAVEFILLEVLPTAPTSPHENQNFVEPSDGGVESEEESILLKPQQVAEEESILLKPQQVAEDANAGPSKPGSIAGEDANDADHTIDALHVDSTCLDEMLNDSSDTNFYDANDGHDQACGNNENEELISLWELEVNSVKVGSDQSSHITSISLLHQDGADDNHDQDCGNNEWEELISLGKCIRVNAGPDSSSHVTSTTLIHEDGGLSGSLNDLHAELEDFSGPMAFDLNKSIHGNSHQGQSCSDSNPLGLGNSVVQTVSSSVQEHTPDALECGLQSEIDSGTSITDCEKPESKQGSPVSETVDVEDESTFNTIVTRSGQICRIDLLEDIIEDAKSNKKTLFSAMDSVIDLMREVELQEQAAEQAKEEAATGGLDILTKVEDLKQMLRHAKEANDMHVGEVYGEKAILATEMRELQSRLLSLSDERDKSLAILDEMRQTLEARLAAAEEERKAAEQEKLEKEKFARNALAEQELIMEKVVQESMILNQEAEENSKLREFLMDRGLIVDMLQGEISVICQDVKLLKERFDQRVPLSKSVSSSQTSCIMASSSSSLKSVSSDQVPEQAESFETPEKTSPIPLADGQTQDIGSPRGEKARDDRDALLDDGWDLFDNDGEL